MRKVFLGMVMAVMFIGTQVSAADLERRTLVDDITYNGPVDWELKEKGTNTYFYSPDCHDRGKIDTMLYVSYSKKMNKYERDNPEYLKTNLQAIHDGLGTDVDMQKAVIFELNGMPCELSHGKYSTFGTMYNYDMEIIFAKERIVTAMYISEETYNDIWKTDIMDIFVSFEETENEGIDVTDSEQEKITQEEITQEEVTETISTPQEDIPLGMKNALGAAKGYLNYSGFSKQSLGEQLEYEGFSSEEIDYALENCNADWNEEAKEKAQSYLDYSSFSREGLYSQLEYEGFTADQIEYALNAVGY